MNEIINSKLFTLEGLSIPDGTTQEEWQEIHRNVLICKKLAGRYLKQSRDWGTKQYGEDYVAKTEVQMEMELGFTKIESGDDKPDLNPQDKSRVFVTIEGISQNFQMWQRKMKPEMETWDKPTLRSHVGKRSGSCKVDCQSN